MFGDFISVVMTPFPTFPRGRCGKLFRVWNPIAIDSFRNDRGRENRAMPFPLEGNGKGGLPFIL